MAKFCFNADRTDAFEFLKTFYERVDVTFELNELNPNESCIILNDIRDRDIFMNLNERLLKIKGFSQPIYIPKWKSIRHQGPYFSPPVTAHGPHQGGESAAGTFGSTSQGPGLILHDKKRTKQFKLSPEEENYALLYAAVLIDQGTVGPLGSALRVIDDVFKNNFWLSFQKELGRPIPFDSLDEIDWTNVIKKYKDKKIGASSTFDLDKKMLHGRVIVDGKTYAAMPFAVGEESIFYGDENDDRRGMIKRRITPADVTLNVSPQFIEDIPNARDFKDIVYQPGVKWAAKWQDPITKKFKYMDIIFTTKKPDDSDYDSDDELDDLKDRAGEQSSDEVNYSDADIDDSDDEVNYSDADVDIDDADADVDDFNDFDDFNDVDDDNRPMALNFGKGARQRNIPYKKRGPGSDRFAPTLSQGPVFEEDQYIIDFKALDEQDRKLPYSYIVSEIEQWEYVHEACKSGFRVVNKLPKVSNKILEIVADAAKIALERTNISSKLNNFVINYADKREALNF